MLFAPIVRVRVNSSSQYTETTFDLSQVVEQTFAPANPSIIFADKVVFRLVSLNRTCCE